MQCPQCQHNIDYSWRVYASNPLGRFTCNECGARYKLLRPQLYYVIAVLFVSLYTGSALALVYYGAGLFSSSTTFTAAYLVHLMASCASWCFFDRRYEATLPTGLR